LISRDAIWQKQSNRPGRWPLGSREWLAGLGAAFVLLAASCGGGGDKFPDEVRRNFMNSCTSSGGTNEQCACSLEAFEKKYSVEEFEKLEEDLTAGRRANEVAEIVVACGL
jgi:hypothetical protein